MYEKTDAFVAAYGEDRLTQIVEAAYGNGDEAGTYGDITFSDIVRHDAINKTLYGYFQHGEEEVCFEIQDGNWAGTVVRGFGEDADLTPPSGHHARVFDMRMQDQWAALPARTALLDLYRSWINGEVGDFQKMERGYAYDAHFAPGLKTTEHYRAYCEKRGVVISGEWVDDVTRITGKELAVLRQLRIFSGPERDTPKAAEREAAYMDGLSLWLADQGRSTAAANARRAAEEWREWMVLFAEGRTTADILAGNTQKITEITAAMAD